MRAGAGGRAIARLAPVTLPAVLADARAAARLALATLPAVLADGHAAARLALVTRSAVLAPPTLKCPLGNHHTAFVRATYYLVTVQCTQHAVWLRYQA